MEFTRGMPVFIPLGVTLYEQHPYNAEYISSDLYLFSRSLKGIIIDTDNLYCKIYVFEQKETYYVNKHDIYQLDIKKSNEKTNA
ncbi:hypothetical protein KY334_03400 [Candidatus Woesearchaeota archaeon]|nr:hypothetical protein [Candidatus Woesearchaeota archaeon]